MTEEVEDVPALMIIVMLSEDGKFLGQKVGGYGLGRTRTCDQPVMSVVIYYFIRHKHSLLVLVKT